MTGGFTGSVDFNPGPGVASRVAEGSSDCFIIELDSSGSFKWVKTWGGTGLDSATGIALDDGGNIAVTGSFDDTIDLNPGPGTSLYYTNGADDAFLLKLDGSGGFLWGASWGGPGEESVYGISIDNIDNIYVTGSFFNSVDFDPGEGDEVFSSNGFADAFASKFPPDGIW